MNIIVTPITAAVLTLVLAPEPPPNQLCIDDDRCADIIYSHGNQISAAQVFIDGKGFTGYAPACYEECVDHEAQAAFQLKTLVHQHYPNTKLYIY